MFNGVGPGVSSDVTDATKPVADNASRSKAPDFTSNCASPKALVRGLHTTAREESAACTVTRRGMRVGQTSATVSTAKLVRIIKEPSDWSYNKVSLRVSSFSGVGPGVFYDETEAAKTIEEKYRKARHQL